jgi:subtilisin family serine protease
MAARRTCADLNVAAAVMSATLGLALICHALASEHGDAPYGGTGRLIVRADQPDDFPALLAEVASAGVQIEETVTRDPLRVVLRVRSGSPHDAVEFAEALRASRSVRYAVPELFLPMELRSRHVPNDPLFGAQWHLENTGQGGRVEDADIDATAAWRYTLGSPDVLIAVLDDGVETGHPDLAANIAGAGRDFTADPPRADANPQTSADRHGTSVAGVAAARGDNGVGVSGVCPRCRILPIRVYGSSNLGTAAAFRYAVEQGADIITNSWGYTRDVPFAADDAVRDAIDEAARTGRSGRGTLIVFGMTNEVIDNCGGPRQDISSLDSVVAVGVSNHNGELGGSGFGGCIDLVAPAKPKDRTTIGIMTTDRTGIDGHTADDYYSGFGGTSAAAPIVAGVAGLLLSLNPDLTRADLQKILEHTAEKIDPARAAYDAHGFSEHAGYGRVNAARALVPSVEIVAAPAQVEVGATFSVTVTASAPFGLESVSWFGQETGIAALDVPRREALDGEAVRSVTWSGLTIDRVGTFVLGAAARDLRYSDPVAGYPHQTNAGRREQATAKITVAERANAVSR